MAVIIVFIARKARANGAVARDVGQVRDVVRRTGQGSSVRLYPSVEAALDAVRHSDGGARH